MFSLTLRDWIVFASGAALGATVVYRKIQCRFLRNRQMMGDFSIENLSWLLLDEPATVLHLKDFTDSMDGDSTSMAKDLSLGALLRRAGLPHKALGLHQSLAAKPNLPDSVQNALLLQNVQNHLALGRPEAAQENLKKLPRRLQKSSSVKALWARTYEHLEKWDQCLNQLHAIVREHSQSEPLLNWYQKTLLELGTRDMHQARFTRAEKISLELLERWPDDRQALLFRMDLAQARGDLKALQLGLNQFKTRFGEMDPEYRKRRQS